MIYLDLFITFFKIGIFGFGGGYGMLSLIQHETVERAHWLSTAEFTDIVAISQMTPGPIAINSATYVGYMVTGNVFGSMLATLAVCVPPLTLMILIAVFYKRLHRNRYVESVVGWLRPLTTGMIGAAALLFLNRETFVDWTSVAIFAAVFTAVWFKADAIVMLVLSAIAGILLY